MKNFGVYLNPHYENRDVIYQLLDKLNKKYNINFYKFQCNLLPEFVLCYKSSITLECILVFGGDGTMLSAVKHSLKTKSPLLGINIGKLGFLSETTPAKLEKSIDGLKRNRYKIQNRMLIDVSLKRNGKTIFQSTALNDAVIYKGKDPKLMNVSFFSNRRFVVQTRCDGIMASTPTGSTAYSLSAGGPILSPVMEALIVAPLNPHVLTVRPMVFSASDNLLFKINSMNEESVLQLDGQNTHNLKINDEIIVHSASEKVSFIKLSNTTFYQILRKKFHLGRQ